MISQHKPFYVIPLMLLLALLQACINSMITSEKSQPDIIIIQKILSSRLDNGFSPLDRPVAIVLNGKFIPLNGPCLDPVTRGCIYPEVRAGQFIIRSTPNEYSLYGYIDQSRTIELIAHEEFHYFQKRGSYSVSSRPNLSSNSALNETAIRSLVAEINATQLLAISDNINDLNCLFTAVEQRSASFPEELDNYFNRLQINEGSAHHTGLTYREKLTGESPRNHMLHELRLPSTFDTGDIFMILHTLSYSLGGLKADIAIRNDLQLQSLISGGSVIEHHARCSDSSNLYVHNSDINAELILNKINENNTALDNLFASLHRVVIYRLVSPLTYVSFKKRYRLMDANILMGDVALVDENGHEVVTHAPSVVLLQCDMGDFIGLSVDQKAFKAEMQKIVNLDGSIVNAISHLSNCDKMSHDINRK